MPFTAAEKTEVLKVVAAAQLLPVSAGKVANALAATTTFPADQPHYAQAVLLFDGAFRSLNSVLQNLVWCYENQSQRVDRASALEDAAVEIAAAISALTTGAAALAPIAALQPAAAPLQQAVVLLSSVNQTLPYATPFPESYPAIIGPHGDYDDAQRMIATSSRTLADALLGVFNLIADPAWPIAANASMADLLRLSTTAQALYLRIMGLTAEVVSAADQATINKDTAQGSGLRPETFFRAVFAHELAMTTDATIFTITGGRHPNTGIGFNLVRAIGAVGTIFAKLLPTMPAQVEAQMAGPASFMATFGQAWKHLDQWSDFNFLFFHEIPTAPPGAPPVQ